MKLTGALCGPEKNILRAHDCKRDRSSKAEVGPEAERLAAAARAALVKAAAPPAAQSVAQAATQPGKDHR